MDPHTKDFLLLKGIYEFSLNETYKFADRWVTRWRNLPMRLRLIVGQPIREQISVKNDLDVIIYRLYSLLNLM